MCFFFLQEICYYCMLDTFHSCVNSRTKKDFLLSNTLIAAFLNRNKDCLPQIARVKRRRAEGIIE